MAECKKRMQYGVPCKAHAWKDGVCYSHHPEGRMAMRRRMQDARDHREADEFEAQRDQAIGYAVRVRMTSAEQQALPQWMREQFGLSP